ncbi:reverse transcriptase domain-containing protein [Tanacetum coccineum]
MWNDLILAHERPSDTRDTKIAALRLKFNAFKSLEDLVLGFSQKGSGVGRGVKETQGLMADKLVEVGMLINVTTEQVVKEKQNSLEDTTVPESFPPLSTPVTTAGNAPGKSSYANITGKPSGKNVNVHTLFTPGGNGIDVVVLVDSIRAISEQFTNTAYGFFLGKKVAYPVVANYNNLLILKKWHPNENLLKEDVSTIPVWVKLHDVPITAFSKDGLSAIATKLADVELNDNIVVAMPKITREGNYTCNVHVEYEWKTPRCSSCKVFRHIHEEFLKYTGAGEKKTVKKPSQTSRGVLEINARDTGMSDSEDSTVTYTTVSSPFADLPDIGSPGVDGPPVMPEDPYAYVVATFHAPPSPNYVLGPEYPPSPKFIPEHVYPEFMLLEDEILPTEEQPLPAAVSPTADSPGYVHESDLEEDPEEDDDEDPEKDPVDYPADGGDVGDDEDESSDDDEDEDVDFEDDEEEEEHPAPADSTAGSLPAVDQALFAEETDPFETDESAATPPHPAYRVTARISIRDEPPTPFWSDLEVARLLAIPTPPPSPLSRWSSPLPQIPSPPLPVSSPVPVISPSPPASPIRPLGYRAAMIRLRAKAASTSHSLPLPPPIILSYTRPDAPSSGTPPLHLLSTDRRADRPEVTLPPRKRLGIALGPRYEVGESSSAVAARPTGGLRTDYGFDEMLVDMPGAPATDDTELGRRMTKFTTRFRQDTDEIYTRGYVVTYSGGNTAGSDYRAISSRPQETGGDYRDAGGRPHKTEAAHRGTEAAEETSDSDDRVREIAGTRQRSFIARCTRGGW